MSVDLVRRLLASSALSRGQLSRVLFEHVARAQPLPRALVNAGALSEVALENELARSSQAPLLKKVVPETNLVDELPPGLAARLHAVPVRLDPRTGTVDVAAVDADDPHIAAEVAFHLKAPVRMIRAPLAAIEDALRRSLLVEAPSMPPRAATVPPPSTQRYHAPPPLIPTGKLDSDAPRVPQLRHESGLPIPLVRRHPKGEHQPPHEEEVVFSLKQPKLPRIETDPHAELEEPVPLVARTGRPSIAPMSMRSGGSSVPSPLEASVAEAPLGPFTDVGSVAAALRRSTSRDEVIEQLLIGMRTVARRVGILVMRRGEYCGFRCTEELGDGAAFRGVVISSDVPSIFATASATGFYVGPMPATGAHAPLLDVMQATSGEVAVMPVRLAGRVALMIFLDQIGDLMIATRRAEDLGRLASDALSRILQGGRTR